MPDDKLLTTEEAAEYLNVTAGRLKWWRHEQAGPPYVVYRGRSVRYRQSDLDDWVEAQMVTPAPRMALPRNRTVPFPARRVAQ